MADIEKEEIYDYITRICIDGYDSEMSAVELMEKAWEYASFPMHCPQHHYLVPAVLLTVCCRLYKSGISRLEKDLETAKERAKNLLPGFCGWYGACGAAIGSGVFLSLLTDTSPYSTKTWGQTNLLTAKCLKSISELGGPRCCKRVCYTSVLTTTRFLKAQFGIKLGSLQKAICSYSSQNAQCLKTNCPYYNAKS